MLNVTGVVPPEGNQPKPMAKTRIRTSPIQKVGRANVEREADTVVLSMKESRLLDAIIPRTTPMIIARIVDDPRRGRVFCSRCCCLMLVALDWSFWRETPKLERATIP